MSAHRLILWLKFFRLPNVLTVPGDVLAGATLAGRPFPETVRDLAAVSLAYLFGMGLNDIIDLREDRLHRPERPLPSGELSPIHARIATAALAFLALIAAPTPALLLLLLAVVAYTLLKNISPLVGGLLMGTCRALALLTGAGFLADWHLRVQIPCAVLTAAVLWAGFIFIVTRLAEREHLPGTPTRLPWLLPVWFIAGLAATALCLEDPIALPAYVFLLLPPLSAAAAARKITLAGGVRPHHIGICLALLFPLQSAALALGQAWGAAAGILLLMPLARLARRWISAS